MTKLLPIDGPAVAKALHITRRLTGGQLDKLIKGKLERLLDRIAGDFQAPGFCIQNR
jgi:hypothetical protein